MASEQMVNTLENLRYKYLSSLHDGPQIETSEICADMITIIYALQVLIDPFKDYMARYPVKMVGEE